MGPKSPGKLGEAEGSPQEALEFLKDYALLRVAGKGPRTVSWAPWMSASQGAGIVPFFLMVLGTWFNGVDSEILPSHIQNLESRPLRDPQKEG